jgi:hypothetical protein
MPDGLLFVNDKSEFAQLKQPLLYCLKCRYPKVRSGPEVRLAHFGPERVGYQQIARPFWRMKEAIYKENEKRVAGCAKWAGPASATPPHTVSALTQTRIHVLWDTDHQAFVAAVDISAARKLQAECTKDDEKCHKPRISLKPCATAQTAIVVSVAVLYRFLVIHFSNIERRDCLPESIYRHSQIFHPPLTADIHIGPCSLKNGSASSRSPFFLS